MQPVSATLTPDDADLTWNCTGCQARVQEGCVSDVGTTRLDDSVITARKAISGTPPDLCLTEKRASVS
jgi:hypothetical protein